MINEIATQFTCEEHELVGICHPATGDKGIVIVTGGPQYRIGSHRQFLLIARSLSQASYPVFRFDYRGMGDSSIIAEPVAFEQTTPDIISAIQEFKRIQPQVRKIVLLGLCDAASAILIALPHISDNVSDIILINPWVYQDKTMAKTYLKYYYIERLRQKEFWIKLLKFKINIRQSLKAILYKYHSAFLIKNNSRNTQLNFIDRMLIGLLHFQGNVLTLLSEDDLTAKEFQLFIQENKLWDSKLKQTNHKSIILPGTDHTFSSKNSRQQVIDNICNWLKEL